MLFKIELTIGGEIHCEGFYSHSTNPLIATSKHRADGISTTDHRWISRATIKNWHVAQVTTLPAQIKKAQACTAYA